MDQSMKDRARASAIARTKPQTRQSAQQGRSQSQGNNLTFFSEDASGFRLSPATVMVICLFYIGSVVLLHVFSKVKGTGASPKPEM